MGSEKIKMIKKYALCFAIGAAGYGSIEMIWRGWTHWSMMIAGGLCFIAFSVVAERFYHRSILFRAGVCAVCVTAIEFVFGVVFNIILGMEVWNYSHMPLNILGQVCPLFSLMWGGIAILFLPLAEAINAEFG